jgi:HPt (histidine-containing phosphotransfer) domain-containing protein
MENFFIDQFDEYVKNITAHIDSNDQLLMYSVAHKLVGSSSYAGAMRVNKITDKMQKAVPKEGINPNFKVYKALYPILMRECKLAAE